MLTSILLLGFVVGLQHAFEADHLAAVSALVSRKRGLREMTLRGAIWGVGHTLALLVISGLVLFSPWGLPATFETYAELAVGLLLIALGSQVLYRLWRDRVHIHAHGHDDGRVHLHAHSHRDEVVPHKESDHDHAHPHPGSWSWKTLIVGLTHGAAGSAALTVFVAATLESRAAGIVYVLIFGLGSILGMMLLSAVISLPLAATARRLTWANRALQTAVGLISIGVGLSMALNKGIALFS